MVSSINIYKSMNDGFMVSEDDSGGFLNAVRRRHLEGQLGQCLQMSVGAWATTMLLNYDP